MKNESFFRKIIHVDMDAFYASVEQRDDVRLQGVPVVVGGDPGKRGVVASVSYEGRKFGIRSAMSCSEAARLCPHVRFVYPDFEKYYSISKHIRSIFKKFTDLVEPLALDEAYLDVTTNFTEEPLARNIAWNIKKMIREELHLTASAGVGPNKFIAKLASELRKPDGLVVVPPERVFDFVKALPVEQFWGIGPASAKKLREAGFNTASDIRARPISELEELLGSYAHFIFELAHGEDTRSVDPECSPKSRGTEVTFERDILDAEFLINQLSAQAQELSEDLRRLGRPGRTLSLKIKYNDFTVISRSKTLFYPTDNAQELANLATELLFRGTEVGSRPIRLIGLSVSNLIEETEPLQLWFDFINEKSKL